MECNIQMLKELMFTMHIKMFLNVKLKHKKEMIYIKHMYDFKPSHKEVFLLTNSQITNKNVIHVGISNKILGIILILMHEQKTEFFFLSLWILRNKKGQTNEFQGDL